LSFLPWLFPWLQHPTPPPQLFCVPSTPPPTPVEGSSMSILHSLTQNVQLNPRAFICQDSTSAESCYGLTCNIYFLLNKLSSTLQQ
jgi:hypothetical protein